MAPVLQPEQQATNLDEEKGWLIEKMGDKELTIYLTIPTNNIYRQLRYLSLTECLYFFKANIIKQLQQ